MDLLDKMGLEFGAGDLTEDAIFKIKGRPTMFIPLKEIMFFIDKMSGLQKKQGRDSLMNILFQN